MSFVIPVRDAAADLDRCLRSIAAAARDAPVEVVVVDNGSRDESAAVAARHGAQVRHEPALRVGALRNAGVHLAHGDVLAFVDADHEVSPEWLDACRQVLALDGVGAAGRLCDAPRVGTWVQRAYECLRERPQDLTDVTWLGAGNIAVRRQVFEQIGGFDESLEACEDVDLCRDIRRAGFRVVSVPGMASIHHGDPATLGAVFRGELWRARDNLRVSLREAPMLRSMPGMVFPIVTLGLLVLAGTGLAALPLFGPMPLGIALAGVMAIAAVRTLVMARRGRVRTVGSLLGCFGVAAVYEIARACALLARARHTTRVGGVTQHA